MFMPDQKTIQEIILKTAAKRGIKKTTCPSEIARALFPADWRQHMGEVRTEVIALQKMGKVEITQGGKPVDIDSIKGPIRIQIVE